MCGLLFALLLGRSGWKRWLSLRFFALVVMVVGGAGSTVAAAILVCSGGDCVCFCFCFCFCFVFFFLFVGALALSCCVGFCAAGSFAQNVMLCNKRAVDPCSGCRLVCQDMLEAQSETVEDPWFYRPE